MTPQLASSASHESVCDLERRKWFAAASVMGRAELRRLAAFDLQVFK
jgi:hypothetical protein